MRGEADSDEELDDEGGGGGYKKRRVRFSLDGEGESDGAGGGSNKDSGDALGDDFVPDAPGSKMRVRKLKEGSRGGIVVGAKGKKATGRGGGAADSDDESGEDEDSEDEDNGEDDGDDDEEEGEGEEGESGDEDQDSDAADDDDDEEEDDEEGDSDDDDEGDDLSAALAQEEESEHLEAGGAKSRVKARKAVVQGAGISAEERAKRAKAAAEELPYTFVLPDDVDGLSKLLTGHSASNQQVILERLMACYSTALDGSNKAKLEHLYRLLLERLQTLAAEAAGDGSVAIEAMDHDGVDAACRGLYKLTHQMPAFAKAEWKAFLTVLQEDVAAGLSSSQGPAWPSGGDLLLLQTIPSLFPCSDFQHPIATPYVLTLAQHLSCCPVRSLGEAAKSLLVVAMLLSAAAGNRWNETQYDKEGEFVLTLSQLLCRGRAGGA